jgi:acetylornithine/succinyldiaminopimelate/putrescine aminotransferase
MIEDYLEAGGRFDDLYTKISEAMQKSRVFLGNSQAEAEE